MSFDPSSVSFLIGLARNLADQVRLAHRRKLAGGVRLLASFVRRLLILMALAMEARLVDRVDPAEPLPRPDGRTPARQNLRFAVLDRPCAMFDVVGTVPSGLAAKHACIQPSLRLYRLLQLLSGIVADPQPRARRVAFTLARRRPHPVLPTQGPKRIAGYWGVEVRASHDAMASAITSASQARPPPLPPVRRVPASVTCL